MGAKRIHVLQIIGEFTSGGAETILTTLSRSLDPSVVNLTITARRDGPVSKDLPETSRLVIIPKRNGFDPIHLRKLVGLVKERNIELIHAHLFGPNLYGFLTGKLTGRKVIQTIHGRDCFFPRRRALLYRIMMRRVDHLVAVSESLEAEFRQRTGYKGNRVSTIHNGVCLSRFHQPVEREKKLQSLGIPAAGKIIGTVGNVKPVKGHDVLIDSLDILCRKGGQDVFLVVAGIIEDSVQHLREYKGRLDQKIKDLGLENRVLFLGVREDIPEILQCFDVFVLPSRSEGLSISLLEAMAASRPVVVTDVGMNGKIVQNGFNGFVVPPESPESLSDAIARVLINGDLAVELAKNASETVKHRFSDKKMAADYMSLYKAVLSR